ncbi:transglutaminase-like superfamily protein [Plectosphaerella cucumerina]|uniref:Transglutaminase-like superfamily protein n=1 Tax=Plectosphaerella cucumerina TaxID=40658 RepID=A0A8K0TMV7_9PEZI|nr:transglutaminase-like superfamily protein [Plectosphaerella cucumerina]
MADVEEPQFTTLAQRIAALNQQKNFQAPEPKAKRPPPPPPPAGHKNLQNRSQTVPVGAPTPSVPPRPASRTPSQVAPPPELPSRTPSATQVASRAPPPPLPTRTNTLSPALPPRRPSGQQLEVRRGSNASEISTLSSLSLGHGTLSSATSIHSLDGSGRKLPPAFDASSLPPLPPTKREREAQTQQQQIASRKASTSSLARPPPLPSNNATHSAHVVRQIEPPQRPVLPPRLSNTSVKQPAQPVQTHVMEPAEPPKPRRLPPPTIPAVKARQRPEPEEVRPPPMPSRPQQRVPQADDDDAPPPIPVSSRPSIAQIEAASARSPPPVPRVNDCLTCRDFSGPDGVAAQYPRETLPQQDVVGYLAHVLCGPFTSYTDKARAIFTWFHHNIAYDCAAFFGNNIRGRTAEETIAKGAAVCSGYADTYKAIAERAGLECLVVTGHGKGYGYTALQKGERPPPKKADGHAWSAVRIDGGEWKLLDACWGAGSVSDATKSFTKQFKPDQFTRSNEIFGETHFPSNERYFFRADGSIPTWEEYYIGRVHGETPTVYTSAYEEGILERTVEPCERQIPVYSGRTVRFQFSKKCEHWTSERHGLGKPPLLFLTVGGRDGRDQRYVVMETDGFWWWADVPAIELGAPGESLSIMMVDTIQGKSGRGLTAREFLSKKGKVAMSFKGIMKWELV